MTKLIITRGLPGSGKSTWAKDWVAAGQGWRLRANRDDLRGMLYGRSGVLERELEEQVTQTQRAIVSAALKSGQDVVVDDTNLRLRFAREWAKFAHIEGVEFEVNDDFLKVPLSTCVERDAQREGLARVGAVVIHRMHQQFFPMIHDTTVEYIPPGDRQDVQIRVPYLADPALPAAILVDIDGTTAQMDGRGPHDYHLVGTDKPRPAVILAVQVAYDAGIEIIFVSGRPDSCRLDTEKWLSRHVRLLDPTAMTKLLMRPTGDNRADYIIKYELFDAFIREHYNVLWAYDDRQQVVDMYRSIGLDVFQVAPGQF